MIVMCAASCGACELLDPAKRCAPAQMGLPDPIPDAYRPGDLEAMFASLPGRVPGVEFLRRDPFVAVIRNFVSEKEGQTLLDLTVDRLERSTDQGGCAPAAARQRPAPPARARLTPPRQLQPRGHPGKGGEPGPHLDERVVPGFLHGPPRRGQPHAAHRRARARARAEL
jgi:hypothetical protein